MKSINEQINPKLVIHAQLLAKYTELLRKILPSECHEHVKVGNIRNQNLMLIADSPVWTTKLRLLSPQILQFLRKNSTIIDAATNTAQIIHHVQISTRYQATGVDTGTDKSLSGSTRQQPHISKKTAKLLSQSASSINHQQLKAALLRVASHGSSDTNNQTKKKK